MFNPYLTNIILVHVGFKHNSMRAFNNDNPLSLLRYLIPILTNAANAFFAGDRAFCYIVKTGVLFLLYISAVYAYLQKQKLTL